ncbi:cytochrome P450 [Aspergillus granulosus]|uniref:Cytochrome P450 n=1 Tax=Aspergillus granulosus TaxID=176169 RepID=A0ABR4HT15_9EURO
MVYRLWLSPIASFPGPFLARISFCYEFYYNWIKPGQYYLEIHKMHQKYGPIVRVSPVELHIERPSFYRKLFVAGAVRKSNAYPWFAQGSGFEDMVARFTDHDAHRAARVPINRFFSRASITRVEPRVMARVQKFCHRLQIAADTGMVVNISNALNSLTSDIISSTIFEEPSDFLEDPDFNGEWYRQSRLRPADEAKTRSNTTIFDHLVHSELVESHFGEGGFPRLAQLIQNAGWRLASHSIATIIVYLCLHGDKQQKLRKELAPLFSASPDTGPAWQELEKVSYLAACIQEGLRISAGAMNRISRVASECDLQFDNWLIPNGTPVSMSSYWMHMDPDVFPNPDVFEPERWIDTPAEKLKIMQSYVVPFSAGSRDCFGKNLAYMEMYHTLAQLFCPGAPRIELYHTDESDVVPTIGLLFPWPRLDSVGVRAFLTMDDQQSIDKTN